MKNLLHLLTAMLRGGNSPAPQPATTARPPRPSARSNGSFSVYGHRCRAADLGQTNSEAARYKARQIVAGRGRHGAAAKAVALRNNQQRGGQV